MRRGELLSQFTALGLLFLVGGGLNCLLSHSERTTFPVMALDLHDGVDRSYAGKYAGDPRFEALSRQIVSMREQALLEASVRTGLAARDPGRFVVRFKDTSSTSQFGASSQPVRSQVGDVILVTVSSEQFVLGVMDVRGSLVHEFIHGLMRDHMGMHNYRALPGWIREGIAVWGAGQLRERSRNVVATAFLLQRDPISVLEELEAPDRSPDAYMLDALVFEYISDTLGEARVRTLVAELVTGREPEEAFRVATGMSWYELRERCQGFVQLYFENLLAESGLFEFQTAQRLHRFGNREAAIELLEHLVDNRPDSLLQPNAWYWIGRWRFEACDYAGAARAFATVLKRFPRHLGLRDDSQYRLATCFTRLEEYERALDELEHFFRVHTTAPRQMQADARYFLGLAQLEMDDIEPAVRNLRIAALTSPNFAEDATYHLSLAHLRRGDLFKSKLVLSELAYHHPRSELLGKLTRKLASSVPPNRGAR